MIRFCDGCVINVDISEYDRDSLMSEIMRSSLQNCAFSLYRNGERSGVVTYFDLLFDISRFDELPQIEEIQYDGNVFDNCNQFFSKHPSHRFVPVYDSNHEVIYMAYQDTRWSVNSLQIGGLFKALVEEEFVSFFDVYPTVKGVALYQLNEVSYYMYLYLKHADIPYKLYGEQWRLLGVEAYRYEMGKAMPLPEYEVMSIYGDKKKQIPYVIQTKDFWKTESVVEQYRVFYELLNANYIQALLQFATQVKKLVDAVYVVNIPRITDLSQLTETEMFSVKHGINLNQNDQIKTKNERDNLYEIYGENLVRLYEQGETYKDRNVYVVQNVPQYSVLECDRKKHIVLCGPCITFQSDLMTQDTIVDIWQKKVDKVYPGQYIVKANNMPVEHFSKIRKYVEYLEIAKEDIFVFIYENLKASDWTMDEVDLTNLYNQRGARRWFSNSPIHVNVEGSHRVANYLYEKIIKPSLNDSDGHVVSYPKQLDDDEQRLIESYVLSYKAHIAEGNNGAIVMNCNPYTWGHDFLISEAAKQVDWLYVFVVEEDLSYFSFKDRYRQVCENTKEYDNVIVLPSGQAILSKQTFASYFQKAMKQEEIINVSDDLKLFGIGIAPQFHIRVRFVGEEPMDNITRQYNEAMKQQLTHYGVEVVEVPRKKQDETIISASLVRKLLENKDYEKIAKLVPEPTVKWLQEYDSVEKKRVVGGEAIDKLHAAKRVCVFGTGSLFIDYWNVLKQYPIEMLCDNDESKWNTRINGILCISPEELYKQQDIIVIIAVKNYHNILNQLWLSKIEGIPLVQLLDIE